MIVTRFAPSPTGYLHLGHAFAALTAARAGERFLLRLEDIDTTRCRPQFEDTIFEDLAWLGLAWEKPVVRQSDRFEAYRAALDKLQADSLLYPCFCTRAEIAAEVARAVEAPHNVIAGPEGVHYPGTCRHLSEEQRREKITSGAPYAFRLDAANAAQKVGALSFVEHGAGPEGEHGAIAVDPLLFGDVVLARKETPASYHLSVVVDDTFQSVTRVTRGNDLFVATHIQRVLQALLGLPRPDYAHHKLILDENGKKFSKRDAAATLRSLRERGMTAENIRTSLGF